MWWFVGALSHTLASQLHTRVLLSVSPPFTTLSRSLSLTLPCTPDGPEEAKAGRTDAVHTNEEQAQSARRFRRGLHPGPQHGHRAPDTGDAPREGRRSALLTKWVTRGARSRRVDGRARSGSGVVLQRCGRDALFVDRDVHGGRHFGHVEFEAPARGGEDRGQREARRDAGGGPGDASDPTIQQPVREMGRCGA